MKKKYKNKRIDFFNNLSETWDSREHLGILKSKLQKGFSMLEIKPWENILDVGCGTGNLSVELLEILNEDGRVTGIDISAGMIEKAKKKVDDTRCNFMVETSDDTPFSNAEFHRIFCLSVWPHLVDKGNHVKEFMRILKPGGSLHIWHVVSRKEIDEIHLRAGETVKEDILPPGVETAAILESGGFSIKEVTDDSNQYLVTGIKLQ
ncbi:MAG: class I SAM-dependent methyltransferase [Deltaproteobacteria bacterium]|nr:class I SAM-dependent methyltransferase [Deltaproteobacteria bacterium]